MNTVKALSLAAGAWTISQLVTFFLLAVTAGLGGRGTARFAWLLPCFFVLVGLVDVVAVVVFHLGTRAWIVGTGWRWLATGLVSCGFALTFVAVFFATLVVLNR